MDSIKYRVWHKIEKRFVELRNINFENNTIGYDSSGEFNKTESESFDNVEFLRFTGLKDKNNTPIFEGDFLKGNQWSYNYDTGDYKICRENDTGHVWYYTSLNIAEWVISFNHLYSESSCNISDFKDVEVVGNIFENHF